MKGNLTKAVSGMLFLLATMSMVASPRQGGFLMQSLAPQAEVVNGGPAAHYEVTVASQGYSGRVALSCGPTPPSIRCSVSPTIVNVGGTVAAFGTVTAQAAGDARPASYPLVITGTADGVGSRNLTLILQVEPRPN